MSHNGKTYIAQSLIAGQGLFARRAIKKGERTIEYTGKKIPTTVADTLTTHRFLFDLENGWTIDGASPENLARYVNHSCAPNCEAEIKGDRIFFYAVRAIAPHEELTIDYGEEYTDEFIQPVGCACARCTQKKTASVR